MTAATRDSPQPGAKGRARRRAIARAAAHVLRSNGIDGLTHRAVAEEASIPLGSTTYYFASKDDLLHAAIEYTTTASTHWLQAWAREQAGKDLVEVLPVMLFGYLTARREVAVFDAETYVLAARRPELRRFTTAWTTAYVDVLSTFVERSLAQHLAYVTNGFVLVAVSGDKVPTWAQASELIRRELPAG
jgi:DNA-binding transcriptional regulator YbjK